MKYIYVVLIVTVLWCNVGYGEAKLWQNKSTGDKWVFTQAYINEARLIYLQGQIDKINKKLDQIFSSGNAIKMTMELEGEFQAEFDKLKAEVEALRMLVVPKVADGIHYWSSEENYNRWCINTYGSYTKTLKEFKKRYPYNPCQK